jgi:Bacterial antitoxin of type II TA system, VapB
MKTTVEISDSLLQEARKVAAREGTTLRVLIEQGLRRVVAERRRRAGAFRLRKASFRGQGLQPGVAGASWEQLREMAYEARGG